MKTILLPMLTTVVGLLRSRAVLHLEILALRQQLAMVTARDRKRPRFRQPERMFWVWLYRIWPGYLEAIALFKPDTLMRWHRQGFRGYWTWRSQRRASGRPPTPAEIQDPIRRISRENPSLIRKPSS